MFSVIIQVFTLRLEQRSERRTRHQRPHARLGAWYSPRRVHVHGCAQVLLLNITNHFLLLIHKTVTAPTVSKLASSSPFRSRAPVATTPSYKDCQVCLALNF